jgi:sec-independent protein translocase protein TatB
MMREAELEEMEKKWREENERIMRDIPRSRARPDGSRSAGLPLEPRRRAAAREAELP